MKQNNNSNTNTNNKNKNVNVDVIGQFQLNILLLLSGCVQGVFPVSRHDGICAGVVRVQSSGERA